MSDKVCLGISYGDLQVKAAYVDGAEPAPVGPDAQGREAAIYFDPHASISSIGVGFPSVLQNVGSGVSFLVGDRVETPENIVERRLAITLQQVVDATNRSPDATVMAVPAGLTHRRRKVLLDCAKRAGFDDVSLIDSCTAAAIGHHGCADEPSTLVVYRLGYGDCEIALVRIARGRCRVVGSAVVPRVSGEMLDALVMESVVLALRERRIFLGLKQFTSLQWLEFRTFAESARILLSKRPEVLVAVPSGLTEGGPEMKIRLTRSGFASRVEPLVERTLDTVHALLDHNELTLKNVDHLLLVGGVAKSAPVSDILREALERRAEPAFPGIITTGAVLQACQVAERDVSWVARATEQWWTEHAPVSCALPEEALTVAGAGPAEFVSVVEAQDKKASGPTRKPGGASTAPETGYLEEVRQVIENGHMERATALLDSVSREVQALRAEIERLTASGPRRMIEEARGLLSSQRIPEAVALSHDAYRRAPEDPAVFQGMMEIHVEAGRALGRPEEYEKSVQVLACAHRHDQTDTTVHKALAERHYSQAMWLRKKNNLERALEVVQTALSYDPKHAGATALLKELTSKPTSSD